MEEMLACTIMPLADNETELRRAVSLRSAIRSHKAERSDASEDLVTTIAGGLNM